jgi:hypothetical protein
VFVWCSLVKPLRKPWLVLMKSAVKSAFQHSIKAPFSGLPFSVPFQWPRSPKKLPWTLLKNM